MSWIKSKRNFPMSVKSCYASYNHVWDLEKNAANVKEDRKSPQESLSEFDKSLSTSVKRWSIICNNNKVSLIPLKPWSFKNQQGSTEVSIEKLTTNNPWIFHYFSQLWDPLARLMDIQALEKHLFHTQVKLILDFTNCSRLYNGKKTINSLLLPCFPMSVVNIETMKVSCWSYWNIKSFPIA